jgi:hypothetical protein
MKIVKTMLMKLSMKILKRKLQNLMQPRKVMTFGDLDKFPLILAVLLFLDGIFLGVVHMIQPTSFTTQAQPIAVLSIVTAGIMVWLSTVTFRSTVKRG